MHINKPIAARAAPFVFYIVVMALSGLFADAGMDVRWIYAIRAGGTALLLMYLHNQYSELAWPPQLPLSTILLSVLMGLLVFLLWINLNQPWMMVGKTSGYDPHTAEGELNDVMVALRLAGAVLVVPVMEELFWRSFIMRWIDRANFTALSPANISTRALFISSILFASEHAFWFAGLMAGLIYGGLYIRTQNLWAPLIAHAVTNGVLGVWVLYTGQWIYW
ncbi:MAG: CAAX prenyl protease-related protein [Methylotenera sp.]|nr:CAAX prenyl protease-related protein [Methylotenera sp.]